MKNQSIYEMQERMGSDATEAEAEAMIAICNERSINPDDPQHIDGNSDEWLAAIDEAIKRTSIIKSFRIATGDARRENREPSIDAEYITIYYRPSDPTDLIAENNGGLHDLDLECFDGSESDEDIATCQQERDEAYSTAKADAGEPCKNAGGAATSLMINKGWITEAQTEMGFYNSDCI